MAGDSDDVYMVGKIASFQIQNLLVAYKERFDKDNFIKNLLHLTTAECQQGYKMLLCVYKFFLCLFDTRERFIETVYGSTTDGFHRSAAV